MAKSVKFSLDFKTAEEEDLYTLDIPLKFEVETSGTIHGLAFWFDVAFIGSYSTVWAPGRKGFFRFKSQIQW